jgi:hypothetical protein
MKSKFQNNVELPKKKHEVHFNNFPEHTRIFSNTYIIRTITNLDKGSLSISPN